MSSLVEGAAFGTAHLFGAHLAPTKLPKLFSRTLQKDEGTKGTTVEPVKEIAIASMDLAAHGDPCRASLPVPCPTYCNTVMIQNRLMTREGVRV